MNIMAASISHSLDALPAKKLARAELRGAGAAKFLGTVHLGGVIERAFALAGFTKDQASREMGYADASTVSKWVADTEAPNFARLWSVTVLRLPLIQALAEAAGSAVEVETTVRLRARTA